jgi:hypothetical protein
VPALSLAKDLTAEYEVLGGNPVITLHSADRIKHRSIQTGDCIHQFRWVSTGKSERWESTISLANSSPAQFEESVGADGGQILTLHMREMTPAAGVVQGRMVGQFTVPGVRIDVPWGRDVWLCLFRSPWFPLKLRLDRDRLSVAHASSSATALVSAFGDGGISMSLDVSGADFKKASVAVKRTLGYYSSEEVMGEVISGSQTFQWNPIFRSFDLLLLTHGSLGMGELENLIRGFGGVLGSGILGGGSVTGDFVLCDGPTTSYTLVLRGHRGLLENAQDTAPMGLSW